MENVSSNPFYTLLTDAGKQKIAAVLNSGGKEKINFATLVVGDGGGKPVNPVATQTELINQVWKGSVESVYLKDSLPNRIFIDTKIPVDTNEFYIREIGLLDEEGVLLAVGNFPETHKPKKENGSERELTVRVILMVENTNIIKIETGMGESASKDWTNTQIAEAILPYAKKMDVDEKIANHNAYGTAHSDIRTLVNGKISSADMTSAINTHNIANNSHSDIRTSLNSKATPANITDSVNAHNTSSVAHSDLRTLVNGKAEVPSLKTVLSGLRNGDVVTLTNPATIAFTNPSDPVAVIELRVIYTSGAVTWSGCQFIGDDLTVGTNPPPFIPGTTGFVCTWSNSLNIWLVKAIYKY